MRNFCPQINAKMSHLVDDQYATTRYLVAKGGRASGKSYSHADGLLFRLYTRPGYRAVICRELRTTISDSVHQLLQDRIAYHELNHLFDITDSQITFRPNKSFVTYKHLRSNFDEVKGLSDYNLAWLFEAEQISKESFEVLDPTIRGNSSQLWIEYNPRLMDDFIHDRFAVHGDSQAHVVHLNYLDNPYCPSELVALAEACRARSQSDYGHIWLGEPASAGLFFGGFRTETHCVEPHALPLDASDGLILSLDHGIAHNTCSILGHVGPHMTTAIQTYSQNGGTTSGHAAAVYDMIQSCRWTDGQFPHTCYYDPSMSTKRKLSEMMYRSDIDEYIELFRERGAPTKFLPANNRKRDGCHAMLDMIDNHQFQVFGKGNKSLVDGLLRVERDENDPEIYAKQDGDDEADSCRYLLVAAKTLMGEATMRRDRQEKARLARLRQPQYAAVDGGWMGA
jgi:PBSX family phage terminase large subunit